MLTRSAARLISQRDHEILSALTHRVRVLSLQQVAQAWWPGVATALRSARRRLEELASAEFVEILTLMVHPELPLTDPLVTWQPRLDPPDFDLLAERTRHRWTRPVIALPVVIATEAAARRFGGSGGRRPRPSEATHDVHVAAVYLRMRSELPTRAASWISEARLPKGKGVGIPDALVQDGRYRTAIEFGGEYSRPKLVKFHQNCADRRYGYEIW